MGRKKNRNSNKNSLSSRPRRSGNDSKPKKISKFSVQKVIMLCVYTLGGLLYLGTFLDAIGNAQAYIFIDQAVLLTSIILFTYFSVNLYLYVKGVHWIINNEEKIYRKLPTQAHLFTLGIILLIWIAAYLNHNISLETENISCDRDNQIGCTIDINESDFVEELRRLNQDNIEQEPWPYIAIKSGDIQTNYFIRKDVEKYEVDFPELVDLDTTGRKDYYLYMDVIELDKSSTQITYKWSNPNFSNSPYRLWVVDKLIYFKGIIRDINTDEMLGWFDENEFQLVEDCGFSWNKDRTGVEIMDKYGFVCFSIDQVKIPYVPMGPLKGLKFKGYFKLDEYYYVYGDDFSIKTKYLGEARKYILKINPTFDHFGEGVQGKRL